MQPPETCEEAKTEPLKQSVPKAMFQKLKGITPLFVLTVLAPTTFAIIYFSLFASDIYISESRFVIRSPQKQQNIGLGALLQGMNAASGQEDTDIVEQFISSRDALKGLNEKLNIAALFSSSSIDRIRRFNGLIWFDNSFELLYKYYTWQIIDVTRESNSSVVTLEVRAFSAEQAATINERLLEMTEDLVNKLNERSRQDMIGFAKREVSEAEAKTNAAAQALSAYRTQKGVFDPEKQSALQLQEIARLQSELTLTKNQMAQIRMVSKKSPQLPVLQKCVEMLESEIAAQQAKVAGGDRSLSEKSAVYSQLVAKQFLAEKQLGAALSSLEQARSDAVRKQLYVERIAQPDKPDKAMEPRRFINIFATFVIGMILWGILSMLIAGVREHHD